MRSNEGIGGILSKSWLSLALACVSVHVAAAPRLPWPRRPGVVLYQLRTGVQSQEQAAFAQVLAVRHAGAVPATQERRSFSRLLMTSQSVSEEDLAAELRATGAVRFAEPDYLLPAAAIPNDPSYAIQWHHSMIGSPAAWDVTSGSSAVTVAICDTGVDATHADLAANLSLPGINIVDGTTNTSPIADHGTAIAGVLGASGNNGLNGTGVNWHVRMIPVRITNNADTTAWCSDMAAGIEWAAAHGAKVINLSYDTTGCPLTIDSAAQVVRAEGSLLFVAAGNSAQNLSFSYPPTHSFLLIGATDVRDKLAPFSNYGTPIDMVAPGVSIWTTSPNNQFSSWSGTSLATPMVAGTAALLWSLRSTFTPDQIQNFLFASAKGMGATGKDSSFGHGRLDAAAALREAQSVVEGNTAPVVSLVPATSVAWPGPALLNAAVKDDGLPTKPGALTMTWSKSSGPGTVTFANPQSAATQATFSYAGSYTLAVTASDGVLSTKAIVTVNVLPGADGAGGLPAPILNLPTFLSLESSITANFPTGYSVARYEWSVQPAQPGLQGPYQTNLAQAGTVSVSWSTVDQSANLSTQSFSPGYYAISVRAFDNSGVISAPAQAYVTLVPADLNSARIFPNPWRADRHMGSPLTFDQLTANCSIAIFTVSGRLVRTFPASPPRATWDLTTDTGDRVASGLYIYRITDDQGHKSTGKFAVIR